ncbi:hypothetical protein D1224_10485 [Henriciella barbarensis]|uniref:HTH luxR-type domain-containing protein n=1 Tax=Henriciella barbarensis TaxID=86342 RepID=A0A399R279_9PROT|nr:MULTISPECIES: LuxR C-terminal-related transcriptional regulator [Henriciella]RIJ24624.1 hypothetical protein D1224_10485 [Henriciella barbarensis]
MNFQIAPSASHLETIRSFAFGPLLVFVSAPEGSGKAEWIEGVRQQFGQSKGAAEQDSFQPIEFIPDFDNRPASVRDEICRSIECAQCRYVLATSQPQPFDFSRLDKMGRVIEIDVTQLALRFEDLVLGIEPRPTTVTKRHISSLLDRTAGWRYAWEIIAREIEGGRSFAELADRFHRTHPKLLRFIEATAVNTLQEDLRNFLMKVAQFGPIDVDFANQITRRSDAFLCLDQASKATGFVRRDGGSRTFWIHPVFREVLTDLAEREMPVELQEVRLQAAHVYEIRSDWLAAARVWQLAGDTDRALRLLTEHADELVAGKGEIASFRAMTRSLPSSSAAALASEIALGAVFAGDFAGAAAMLEETGQRVDTYSQQEEIRREALNFVIDFGFEQFENIEPLANDWLMKHPTAEPRFRAIVAASLFFSCFADNKLNSAKRALEAFRLCLKQMKSPFLNGWLAIMSALERKEVGDISAAERALEESSSIGAILPAVEVARAHLAWLVGDVARSKHLISRYMQSSLQHGTVELALLAWETAINLEAIENGAAAALAMAEEAESWIEVVHGDRGRKSLRVFSLSLMLRSGMRQTTRGIGAEIDLLSSSIELFGPSRRLLESSKLLRARYAALGLYPRQAISDVQPIIRESLQQSRLLVWCEASLIYAGALVRMGQQERALRIAWNAIAKGAASGLQGTICSEGILLAPLLDDLMDRAELENGDDSDEAIVRETVFELARRSGRKKSFLRASEPSASDEIEADVRLTAAEQHVLELVAAGASNSEIGERLLIKLSTVKWHMQNILRKFDVTSRTAAVAQARRIGLLAG